jgi:hypothetical protein
MAQYSRDADTFGRTHFPEKYGQQPVTQRAKPIEAKKWIWTIVNRGLFIYEMLLHDFVFVAPFIARKMALLGGRVIFTILLSHVSEE